MNFVSASVLVGLAIIIIVVGVDIALRGAGPATPAPLICNETANTMTIYVIHETGTGLNTTLTKELRVIPVGNNTPQYVCRAVTGV